jgi:GTP-binding protein
MPTRLSSVVLVGRPNVGKSTLFNRLTRMRRAIVTAIPGTTRDVIAQPVERAGHRFELVDTGGMFGASEDPLHALVLERGRRAVTGADLLVFLTDGREGLVSGDREIADVLRAANVPVILAINKMDDKRARAGALDFFQLGFDPILEVSAEHGEGVGELFEAITERLPRSARTVDADVDDEDDDSEETSETAEDGAGLAWSGRKIPDEVAVAIIGRPNAGKSSLVNRLLREERMIVSEMPGTTRDAVDTLMTWHKRHFRIVDTAGIRRPGKVASGGQVENVSVLLARRAIEDADIVVLVIDASLGALDQDAAIAGEADKAGRGVIIAANKWDLVKQEGPDYVKAFDEALRRQLKFLDYAPILHISAATGERTPKVLEHIDRVAASRRRRVKTPELNKFVATVTAANPPQSPGNRHVRILYAAQTGVAPPMFVFFTNIATTFHFSYQRFLVNQLRDAFGFEGTPIRLQVRARRTRGGGSTKRAASAKRSDSARKKPTKKKPTRKKTQARPATRPDRKRRPTR